MSSNSFKYLELEVLRWAEARKIIQHGQATTQLLKTVEELGELISGVLRNDRAQIVDGLGDVMVTLIVAADLLGTDVTTCLAHAYDEIKDRKGTLTPQGVFVKEAA